MKQSEMKARIELEEKRLRDTRMPPQTYTVIKCQHKVYSGSVRCYLCWSCPKCGRHGCDNLYMMRPEDHYVEVECDLEEG